jgi:hypothetical protein
MATSIVGDFTGETVWYDIQANNQLYRYNIVGLGNKNFAVITAYSKTGNATPIVAVNFLNAANTSLLSFNTVDTDSGSSTNPSEARAAIPAGTAFISFLCAASTAFISVEYLQFSVAPAL